MRQRWSKTVGIIVTIVALLAPAGARTLVNQTANPNGTYADLVDALTREGRFSILIRAINVAGLTQALRGKGPITLFAPADAAFNKVPKPELDSLFKNPAELKQVVLHHMVAQRVSFKGMRQGDPTSLTLRMLDGSQVGLLCDLGHTRHWFGADKAAEIVRTDIVAGNGLIQEIDAVVAPGKNTPFGNDSRANSRVVGSGEAGAAGGGGSGRDTGRAAAAGGGGTGRDTGRAAAAGGGGSGRDAGKTGLNGTGGIAGDGGIAAAAGGAGSGREGKGTSDQAGSLMDILNRTGSFRILIGLLNKAGLTTLLQDPHRSLTIFAPDDKAFSGLDKQLLSVLMSDSRAAREWLLPYILSGRFTSQELASPQWLGKPVETLAGRTGRVHRQGEFLVYELEFDPPAPISPAFSGRPGTRPCCARIVSADHPASNGVFHVIAWGDGTTGSASERRIKDPGTTGIKATLARPQGSEGSSGNNGGAAQDRPSPPQPANRVATAPATEATGARRPASVAATFLADRGGNWDFESGLTGWSASGDAFRNQPTYGDAMPAGRVTPRPVALGGDYWNVPYPLGHHGSYWIGTGENHPGPGPVTAAADEARTGILTSAEFTIRAPFITFLVGGGNDVNRLRVELRVENKSNQPGAAVKDDAAVAMIATGLGTDLMHREVWDVSGFIGRQARISIVDQSTTGHINVDDFRFTDTDPRPQLIAWRERGYTLLRDPDAPLWGLADTHTHPMANLGFGGNFIAGGLDGDLASALHSCEAQHGIGGTGLCPGGNCAGNLGLAAAEGGVGHRTSGFQNGFDGWPLFTSLIHQQMYIDFIRRAWQGGLRLMVAHAVNTELLAHEFHGTQPGDDLGSVEVQIREMKDVATRHSDFMEIALTPADARRIIVSGKLAIVLGVEVDSLGGCSGDTACSDNDIHSYVDHLYNDLGVRHVFPVHVANNQFGGAAIYKDEWDVNNFFTRGDHLNITCSPTDIQFRMGNTLSPIMLSYEIQGAETKAHPGSRLPYCPPPFVACPDPTRVRPDCPAGVGHINTRVLTPSGHVLIGALMDHGMIIDVDHMGLNTKQGVFQQAYNRKYPVISGHSGFTELSLPRSETANSEKLPSEATLNTKHIEMLRKLGGMVAPITVAKDLKSWGNSVPNDCAGSAKSWAQSYLYALDKMGGNGVALSTDYTLVVQSGPRFGFKACYETNGEGGDNLRGGLRPDQVSRQAGLGAAPRDPTPNGVRYDTPIQDLRDTRFDSLDDGLPFDGDLKNAFRAILLWQRSHPTRVMNPGGGNRILNIAIGLGASSEEALTCSEYHPRFVPGNCLTERRAGFLAATGANLRNEPGDVAALGGKIVYMLQYWRAMQGPNPPLTRFTLPTKDPVDDSGIRLRDYDINIDGLAHYGMLPDFLQDLKNVGLTSDQMLPLFRSAQAYIEMWERANGQARP